MISISNIIKNIKNKWFIFVDKFRKHRIFEETILGYSKFYCQYKTILTGKWKTYQTYDETGRMHRAVFQCSDKNIAFNMANEFMYSISNHMYIGWNNFNK